MEIRIRRQWKTIITLSTLSLFCVMGIFRKYLIDFNRHYNSTHLKQLDSILINDYEGNQIVQMLTRKQRALNEQNLEGYKFHSSLGSRNLSDFLPVEGGTPIRNLVVASWRFGSTFLGDLLQSHPASFYHYEPLLPYGIMRIKNGPIADMAIKDLRKLMHCTYDNLEHYFVYGKAHWEVFIHNKPLWNLCYKDFQSVCFEPKYWSEGCSVFPFQNIKTVRLQLKLVESLLQDESLNLKVLLLIRDPRGSIQSRHHRDWCKGVPDCDNPKHICKDLLDDFKAFEELSQKFENSVKVVRYEDLSLNISLSKNIFDFFRLSFSKDVKQFLNTHTKKTVGGVSSTYRDSKKTPTNWKEKLSWSEVKSIQSRCESALKIWGYRKAYNESHMKSFDPIGHFEHKHKIG